MRSFSIPKPPASKPRRRPRRRDRLRRAAQPLPDRHELPRLHQSRARRCRRGAFRVHGLSDAFLADKPVFAAIADEFIGLHRRCAARDPQRRLRRRLPQHGVQARSATRRSSRRASSTRCRMARRKHPGASNSLDALCSRYGIDNTRRTKHGALLDSEILAEVYIELIGGKQTSLGLGSSETGGAAAMAGRRPRRAPAAPAPAGAAPRRSGASRRTRPSCARSKAPLWSGLSRLTDDALSPRPRQAVRRAQTGRRARATAC